MLDEEVLTNILIITKLVDEKFQQQQKQLETTNELVKALSQLVKVLSNQMCTKPNETA
jgi:hypothetical protein